MPELGHTLGRAWDSLLNGFAYVAGLLVVTVTFAVLYEVVARYFFNSPTIWAVDLTEYSLVYITFLAPPGCFATERTRESRSWWKDSGPGCV